MGEAGRSSARETAVYLNHPNFRWNDTAEDIAAAIREVGGQAVGAALHSAMALYEKVGGQAVNGDDLLFKYSYER